MTAKCGKFQTCINDRCECSLDAGAAVPYSEQRDGFRISEYVDVKCWNDQMRVTINKCALNVKGFKLRDMYFGGEKLTFQANGPKACHGQLKYTPEGTMYEFNIDSNQKCGSNVSFDEN